MLKVVYIVTTVDGYGADKSILNNILFLSRNKFVDPLVIIPKAGFIEYQLQENHIKYLICDYKSWFVGAKWFFSNSIKRGIKANYNKLKAYFLAKKILKNNYADIVHTNTMTTNFGMCLSRFLRSKHIMHIRELPIEQFNFKYEYGEDETVRLISRESQYIVVNSEYVASKFRPLFNRNKLTVVNNGIFSDRLNNNPNSYDFRDGIRFVIAGRLQEDKGQMIALKAMAILKKKAQFKMHLDIYGDGELRDELYFFIKRNKLNELVTMIPYVKDLNARLRNYHVGLICSRCEAFGRAIVEYMGSGLAVIGNDSGNIPLLISDRGNGLLVSLNDPNDLAEKILYLIQNNYMIRQYGQKGYELVRENYTIRESSQKLMGVYQEVVI